MFHGKHAEEPLQRAAAWAGVSLSPYQLGLLVTYAEWLISEAIPAGGLGPAEADRIIDRHVADSLVFGAGWVEAPENLVDVGSGAGLPGIPLAVAFPEMAVTLLDRSQRRTDLAGRVVRILGLDNVDAVQDDAQNHPYRYAGATFRGSLPATEAMVIARNLLESGGVAVIGLRRGADPGALPETERGEALRVLQTPDGVLDSPAWHLRMTVT